MAVLRHDHVIRLKAICIRPPCLLTEYCSNRSLADVLEAAAHKDPAKAQLLTWRRRVRMVRRALHPCWQQDRVFPFASAIGRVLACLNPNPKPLSSLPPRHWTRRGAWPSCTAAPPRSSTPT